MQVIAAWQCISQRRPVAVMSVLCVLFTACVMGTHALNSIVYNNAGPGALMGAIIALYLAATFILGLTTPLRVGSVGPVLGLAAGTLLWPLTPWESYDDLTYDSGWAGAVVYTLIPCGIVWLVARFGRNLGGRRK